MIRKLFVAILLCLPMYLCAQDIGQASYYAHKFHGRKTANGERFNMHEMTAAHRTLPFGTVLLVTNLSNDKSIIVRINDRGPFAKKRIIDLSYGAARELDFIHNGVTKVRIQQFNFRQEFMQPILPDEIQLLDIAKTTIKKKDDLVIEYFAEL